MYMICKEIIALMKIKAGTLALTGLALRWGLPLSWSSFVRSVFHHAPVSWLRRRHASAAGDRTLFEHRDAFEALLRRPSAG